MSEYHPTNLALSTQSISHERLDGEVVIISMLSGKYFSTNVEAADIFWLVQHGIPQNAWGGVISASYTSFDGSGISEFINACVENEIFISGVSASGSESSITLPADHARGAWSAPRLSTFSDLQDLLMIDPIHDASVEGWPLANNG